MGYSKQLTSSLGDFGEGGDIDVLVGKVLEEFLSAAGDVSTARKDEDEGTERARHLVQRDLVSGVAHRVDRHVAVVVVVSQADMLQQYPQLPLRIISTLTRIFSHIHTITRCSKWKRIILPRRVCDGRERAGGVRDRGTSR